MSVDAEDVLRQFCTNVSVATRDARKRLAFDEPHQNGLERVLVVVGITVAKSLELIDHHRSDRFSNEPVHLWLGRGG